jgi:hypothetical protein
MFASFLFFFYYTPHKLLFSLSLSLTSIFVVFLRWLFILQKKVEFECRYRKEYLSSMTNTQPKKERRCWKKKCCSVRVWVKIIFKGQLHSLLNSSETRIDALLLRKESQIAHKKIICLCSQKKLKFLF